MVKQPHAGANLNLRIKPNVKKLLVDGANRFGIPVERYLEEMIVDHFLAPTVIKVEEYELHKRQPLIRN